MNWVALGTGAEAAVVVPDGVPRGGIVVAGELFGVTDHLVRVLDRLADEGFVAAAPDVFWRSGRRTSLSYDQAGRERGLALLNTLEADDVVADVGAARELVGDRAGEGAGLAMLGFSAGGHIAVLAATRMPFDLVVSVYGAWTLRGGVRLADPRPPLEDAEAIAGYGTYFLGAVGTKDHVISTAEWSGIEARLTEAGVDHELITYPGRPHGFLVAERVGTYDAEASDDTWRRILEALDRRVARAG